MIREVALIEVKPGQESAFEEALRQARAVLQRAKGCRGYAVDRSIENPSQYRVLISWDTVENHMVDFREGPLFAEWRALIGPHFASPPKVEHFSHPLEYVAF